MKHYFDFDTNEQFVSIVASWGYQEITRDEYQILHRIRNMKASGLPHGEILSALEDLVDLAFLGDMVANDRPENSREVEREPVDRRSEYMSRATEQLAN